MEQIPRSRQIKSEASRIPLIEKLRSDRDLELRFKLGERPKRNADVPEEDAIPALRVSLGDVAGNRRRRFSHLRCKLEAMRRR